MDDKNTYTSYLSQSGDLRDTPEHLIYSFFEPFLLQRYSKELGVLFNPTFVKRIEVYYDLIGQAVTRDNNLWYAGLVSGFDGTNTQDEEIKFWVAYIHYAPAQLKNTAYQVTTFSMAKVGGYISTYFLNNAKNFDEAKVFSQELQTTGVFITLLEYDGLVFIAGVVQPDIAEIRVDFPNRQIKKFPAINNRDLFVNPKISEKATKSFFGILGEKTELDFLLEGGILEVSSWKEELQLNQVHFIDIASLKLPAEKPNKIKTTILREIEPAYLIVSKEKTEQELKQQLEQGLSIKGSVITNAYDYHRVEKIYLAWVERNKDIVSTFFSSPSMANEYRENTVPYLIHIDEMNLQGRIVILQRDIERHSKELRSILENLDTLGKTNEGF